MQDNSPAPVAHIGACLVRGLLTGLLLTLMFAGAVLLLRCFFAIVRDTHDTAFADAVIITEIDDLRHTPWPILTDSILTPPERRLVISAAHTQPLQHNARPHEFTSTRRIVAASEESPDTLRAVIAVNWFAANGGAHVRYGEALLDRVSQDTPAAPRLAGVR